jgi:flagellar protein FliL
MPDATAPAPATSSNKLVVLLATLVLLLLAAGGAAAWYFLVYTPAQGDVPARASNTALRPVFSTLEPFTVNLLDERGERFAQIGLTLEVRDSRVDNLIKDRLPAVRNSVLLLISSKRIEELLTPEGKARLADEVRHAIGLAIGWDSAEEVLDDEPARASPRPRARAAVESNPVRAVLFSQFLVQ